MFILENVQNAICEFIAESEITEKRAESILACMGFIHANTKEDYKFLSDLERVISKESKKKLGEK